MADQFYTGAHNVDEILAQNAQLAEQRKAQLQKIQDQFAQDAMAQSIFNTPDEQLDQSQMAYAAHSPHVMEAKSKMNALNSDLAQLAITRN